MQKRRVAISLLAAVLAVMIMGWGCNRQNSANGSAQGSAEGTSVAIVDYDKVLHDMGWATKMENDVGSYHDELARELQSYRGQYEQGMNNLQKSLGIKPGDTLTPAQQQQLTPVIMSARQTLSQLETQANDKWMAYRGEWSKRYKDAISPIVRQVAQKGGYKIIIAKTDVVVFLDPGSDLSNAVVDAAKAQPPTITDVPMTALQPPTAVSGPTSGPSSRPASMPTSSTKP